MCSGVVCLSTSLAHFLQQSPLKFPRLRPPLPLQPGTAGCVFGVSGVNCATDSEFISVVQRTRAAFPRPDYLITTAAWSIGAYGQGAWMNSQPQGDHTGMSVNVLKAVGTLFDIVNVVSQGCVSLLGCGLSGWGPGVCWVVVWPGSEFPVAAPAL